MAEVTRVVGHSTPQDARRTICQVATDVAGAATAMIWEVGEDGALHNTCALGAPEPGFVLGEAERENGACVAWRTGQPLFVADATTSPRCDPRLIELIGARSAHFQPIPGRDGIRGALTISWREPLDAVPAHAALLLEVLAGEAAVALERDDLLRQLSDLSRTDELTGLPNRRAWDELLDRELRVARRTGQPVTVAMLDLDHFKAFNDRFGHQAGDRLLAGAAGRWTAELRPLDAIARYGGEEFLVLLPEQTLETAALAAERLRASVEGLGVAHPDGGLVTITAGVAGPAESGDDADELVGRADAALYAAKIAGRNRVEIARPAEAPPAIRVMVADDDELVKMLLSTIAEHEPTLELVGTAADAKEAVEVAVMRRPQVVLLDLEMPAGGGTVAATEILRQVPDARIVAMSSNDSQVAMLEMARAGAVGYIVKGAPPATIVDTIRSTAKF
jgi:diguanylate cyclase (GGDEF)-like protein